VTLVVGDGTNRDPILRDQIDYYRARAAEYDEWWFRQGRYDRGEDFNARWHGETAAVETAFDRWLARLRPRRVLELACGTGLFTRRIAPHVERLTAVDASSEVIDLNRARVAADNVDYVQADLFDWVPPARYDAVFFSFWLSHVPETRFDAFWRGVAAALTRGGAIYLIDSAFDPTSAAKNHALPSPDAGVVTRKLNDGREFRIVKIFWEPQRLSVKLGELGWKPLLAQTPRYFIYGEARPR
jgi:2-polyprenyl-3-methyl-5-hydroxy-6-metoxy-1,4-benzoquinol methylase